jgi:hypothetical protein
LGELIEPGSVFSAIGRQFAPIHHRPATDSKATVTQIAAHSTNDSTNTRINACPWLNYKAALVSDRGDGDGSTPTLQKSAADAPRRDIPAHLLLSDRAEQPSAFSHGNTTQSSTPLPRSLIWLCDPPTTRLFSLDVP